MEMDWKTNMAELGGSFMVSWLVLANMTDMGAEDAALGSADLMAAVMLAAAMAAMAGAHILPMFTWISAMTGDLQDTDAWIGSVMRLVFQVLGAGAALALMAGDAGVSAAETAPEMWAFDMWGLLGMVAAGAVIGAVASRCDGWVTAFAVVALAGSLGMGVGGAEAMAAEVMGGGAMVEAASTWVLDGAIIGVGAKLGGMLDDAL